MPLLRGSAQGRRAGELGLVAEPGFGGARSDGGAAMNFDRLAGVYRGMERVGRSLRDIPESNGTGI